MKVCFLAGTLGRGGAERQLVYMLRALKQAGVSTRVLCLTEGESFEREIKALGIPLAWVGASRSRPLRLYRIIQALRREPVDILQSVHFYTNSYAAAAARVLAIREIGAIRNDLYSELEANGAMGKAHLRSPRHLIANSALGRQRAIARGVSPDRIDFLRNAVDAKWSQGERLLNGDHAARILFVGRLTEQKHPERFVRVLSRVVQKLPGRSVTARIAGDGPLRPDLETLAASLGLGPDRLEFLGERRDMEDVYRGSDMVVMTSEWEGTPNALLEAMACRIPVAATGVGGIPELLAEGRGLLVDRDDEEGLTDAILRLVTDAKLRQRLGTDGHEYVARFHSQGALGEQLTGIYQKILSK